jgi:hypothetical protein
MPLLRTKIRRLDAERRALTQIRNAAQSLDRFLTAATAWFAMCTWHIAEGPRQKFGSCGI